MINDAMRFLGEQTVIMSFLLVAILALRPLIRTAFDSRATYLLWLILPLGLAAQKIPAHPQEAIFAPVLENTTIFKQLPLHTVHDKLPQLSIWFCVWITGVLVVTGYFFLQHRRFIRSMGKLHPQHEYFIAETKLIGPVLLGLWRPVIVMPWNFASAFSDHERKLMLTHELTHQQRRDPVYNLMCAVMLAIWWFHPLAHIAASRFRHDQELACDAIVLAQFPQSKRIYADALLKISSHFHAGLIHCHFPHQPFRKRIMEIFKSEKNHTTRALGNVLVSALIGLTSYAAWASNATQDMQGKQGKNKAEQTAQSTTSTYILATSIQINDQTSSPRLLVKEGEAAKIAIDLQGARWEISFLVTQESVSNGAEKLGVKVTAQRDHQNFGDTNLVLNVDEQGRIDIADTEKNIRFNLQLRASKQDQTKQSPRHAHASGTQLARY